MDSVKLNSWLGVLANIGVLIGIVFLAIEIRHASNIRQAQMADAAVAGHNELNLAVISDPQVARMFVVGLYEPDKLSDAEAVQFAMYIRSAVNQHLRLRRMHQLGFTTTDGREFELRQLADTLSTPGGVLFLESNREVFPAHLLEELQPFFGKEMKDDYILGRKDLPLK
jgi:hypothetical protein